MGVINGAVGDAVLTCLWVFNLPLRGVLAGLISASLGVESLFPVALFIKTVVATVDVLMFMFLGRVLGGASFNPSTTITFYTAGLRPEKGLMSMAVRIPAQAAGGIAGAKAISEVMPSEYKHRLKGPFLKVGLLDGAIAEGLVTFAYCFALLLIMMKGPKILILQVWFVSLVTAGLVLAASGYTGPSINPANASGWAYVHNRHNSWEFFYVYWISPFLGANLAALVFKIMFLSTPAPTSNKQKKA